MQESKVTNSSEANSNSTGVTRYIIPPAPAKNESLRTRDMVVNLTTNLLKLEISKEEQKLLIYSVSILPELAKDNFTLYTKIQRQIDNDLNKFFTRKCFSGNNLFASTNNPKDVIICKTIVENTQYTITLKKVSQMEMSEIKDFEGVNQRKKSFLEKVIKDILLKNKNTVKFGDDRTIVKITDTNVYDPDPKKTDKESIYKGFYTSAQITENGLFLLVLNVNKHVSAVTVYDKIKEIRNENRGLSECDIRKVIEDYFNIHKTVLTTYGALRTYRIKAIDFDKNPDNLTFNVKDGNKMKTITISDYYSTQYKIKIRDKNQPLIIAERKTRKKRLPQLVNGKEEPNEKQKAEANNINQEEEQIIYLVPELLYTTGTNLDNDSKDKRRNIISKTKIDPNKKMEEINKINELMNNKSSPKSYKGKDGQMHSSKTSAEVSQEWGIKLGENLSIKGRILPQPHLQYGKNQIVNPNNGNFRSGSTLNGANINNNNFVFIYDKRDNSDIRNSLKGLFDKGRLKGLKIEGKNNELPQGLHGIAVSNFSSWDDIKRNFGQIEQHANQLQMAIVFLSSYLEKYYSNLKDYFTNVIKIPTQFVISKKLQDPRRAGSIMFNIVEQINIKMGGTNFYIDFYNDNILQKGKIYLILGLETRQINGEIHYAMTSSTNKNLNKMITIIRKCKNNREEKEKTIADLMQTALKGLRKEGAPHPPDFIILYRQGGNYVQNRKLAESEVQFFTDFLNYMKEKSEGFKKIKPKFIYLCCNLKGQLKFFERNRNIMNPKSGLCVDSEVTQKDKYEFYIQPQYVNQGTATPCHYQVLYEDRDKDNPNNNLKIEQLQLLSFYLSFYYWTWAGAVRVPGALKLAATAMEFFSKHLNGKLMLPEQIFKNPSYI